MRVSVVIVTWNSADDIASCLDSLPASAEHETIVVDNASTDRTPAILAFRPGVLRICNARNRGYAKANNQGIAAARGDYVLLLNPDAWLTAGALDHLAGYLDTHPSCAAVAPKLLNPDGSVQESIRDFPSAATVLWEMTGLARLLSTSRIFGRWRMRWFDYQLEADVPQPMTSCLLVRREVLVELGGMDGRFPIFYNDVDLCRRLWLSGRAIHYLPSASVYHRRGASTRQSRVRMIWESHRALLRYLAKHDASGLFWLKACILVPLLEAAALLRVFSHVARSSVKAIQQRSQPACL